ncbi:MAG TPA: hypothetical protein VGQ62_10880 [Chloroflexota bacterium]|nr:hypothetical protein [Chloroflexota bacterium]
MLLASPAGAFAQSLPGGEWMPAAGAAGDNTLKGFIDQPTGGSSLAAGATFAVSGWVVDTTAEGWAGVDDVQVLLGGTVLGHAVVGLSRPDVAGVTGNPYFISSGFRAVVGGSIPAGMQTLTVLAHTPGRGSWAKTVSVTIGSGAAVAQPVSATGLVAKIISPRPEDVVVSNNNGTIYGIAYDTRTRAELGIGVDRVQVYMDGPRGEAGSQYFGDASFVGTGWSVSWQPTKYNHILHHNLWVYVRSSVSGEELLLNQEINLSS